MPRYSLIVMTNPVPGREAEYNDWYTNVHLPDVLRIPGVVSAQRFSKSEIQRDAGPHPWDYLAIYECETDDPTTIVAELKARSGTAAMPISNSLGKGDRLVCFFEPITETVTAAD